MAFRHRSCGGFEYETIDSFEQSGALAVFTTRYGGVSTGHFSSMNLNFGCGDKPLHVVQNFQIICDSLDLSLESFVLTAQTHTNHIRIVGKEDCGTVVAARHSAYLSAFTDTDGLITDSPGVTLTAFFADCVPVYLFDPRHRVIALVHAGWKGTVSDIAGHAVLQMQQRFGCLPADILAAIGPSIGPCHFEIGPDVCQQLTAACGDNIIAKTGGGKTHVDLWACNVNLLERRGIRRRNITVSGECTCCNPDRYFSHRYTQGKRGNMAALLSIPPEHI